MKKPLIITNIRASLLLVAFSTGINVLLSPLFSPLLAEDENRAEIVVTGDRREKPVEDTVTRTEVISRQQIEAQGSRNLAEILRSRNGIEIKPAIRGQEVRLQGLSPEYVLILVDGDRVTGRLDGAIDLTRFKAEEIERVEIIKGPSSALYGADALGGVINIITRDPKEPARLSTELQYGSGRALHYGSGNETHASATTGVKGERISTLWTTGWHRSDGYDLDPETNDLKLIRSLVGHIPGLRNEDLPVTEGTTGSSYQDLNVSNRTKVKITDAWDITGRASYHYLNQEKVDYSPPRTILDRTNETHDVMAGLRTDYRFGTYNRLSIAYSHARFLDTLTQDQRASDELDSEEVQDDRVQEARAQLDIAVGSRHMLSVGVEGLWEEYKSPRISEGGYGYRQRASIFAQDEFKPFDDYFYIVPGLRYESDSQFGSQTTPKLSMRWDPSSDVKLRFGVGRGYRAPSFKDLYFAFQNPGVGYQVVGNENLKPEHSVGYNGGIEYEPKKWLWIGLDGYYNSITNLIDFRRTADRKNDLTTYQTVNVSKAYTRGAEFLVEIRPVEKLRFAVGYTLTDTLDRLQDIPLEGRSLHRGIYRISYGGKTGLGISLQGSVNGKQAFYYEKESLATLQGGRLVVDRNVILRAAEQNRDFKLIDLDPNTPDYGYEMKNANHILDLRLSYKFLENYEAFVGVDNMLDHYDAQLDPIRPRFFYFGVRTNYSAPVPTADKRIESISTEEKKPTER